MLTPRRFHREFHSAMLTLRDKSVRHESGLNEHSLPVKHITRTNLCPARLALCTLWCGMYSRVKDKSSESWQARLSDSKIVLRKSSGILLQPGH